MDDDWTAAALEPPHDWLRASKVEASVGLASALATMDSTGWTAEFDEATGFDRTWTSEVLVLIDDQLSVLAALGVLDLPEGVDIPVMTTRFHIRIAGGLVIDRGPSVGVFQKAIEEHAADPTEAPDAILRPDPARLRLVDARPLSAGIVRAKSEHQVRELPAEVVAAAQLQSQTLSSESSDVARCGTRTVVPRTTN